MALMLAMTNVQRKRILIRELKAIVRAIEKAPLVIEWSIDRSCGAQEAPTMFGFPVYMGPSNERTISLRVKYAVKQKKLTRMTRCDTV